MGEHNILLFHIMVFLFICSTLPGNQLLFSFTWLCDFPISCNENISIEIFMLMDELNVVLGLLVVLITRIRMFMVCLLRSLYHCISLISVLVMLLSWMIARWKANSGSYWWMCIYLFRENRFKLNSHILFELRSSTKKLFQRLISVKQCFLCEPFSMKHWMLDILFSNIQQICAKIAS